MGKGCYQSQGEGQLKQADFSRASVSKAVLSKTLQRPYVLYPGAVGILGLAGAVLLGPSMLFMVPAVTGLALGFGAWSFDYFFRRDMHAGAYLRHLHESMGNRRRQALANLERDLKKEDSKEGLSQLARLGDKYRAFEDILGNKLDPSELTYGRYLGMAEQVFLSCLDNLQRIVDTYGSIRAIDEAYLSSRIRELEAFEGPSESQLQELEALRVRFDLRRQQLEKVDLWLAQNESAMTIMDTTMAAVAEMTTVKGHASTDMETAMNGLQELARRAPDYSVSGD